MKRIQEKKKMAEWRKSYHAYVNRYSGHLPVTPITLFEAAYKLGKYAGEAVKSKRLNG